MATLCYLGVRIESDAVTGTTSTSLGLSCPAELPQVRSGGQSGSIRASAWHATPARGMLARDGVVQILTEVQTHGAALCSRWPRHKCCKAQPIRRWIAERFRF